MFCNHKIKQNNIFCYVIVNSCATVLISSSEQCTQCSLIVERQGCFCLHGSIISILIKLSSKRHDNNDTYHFISGIQNCKGEAWIWWMCWLTTCPPSRLALLTSILLMVPGTLWPLFWTQVHCRWVFWVGATSFLDYSFVSLWICSWGSKFKSAILSSNVLMFFIFFFSTENQPASVDNQYFQEQFWRQWKACSFSSSAWVQRASAYSCLWNDNDRGSACTRRVSSLS